MLKPNYCQTSYSHSCWSYKDNTFSCPMWIHLTKQSSGKFTLLFFRHCIFLLCWLRSFLLTSSCLTCTHRLNTTWAHIANKHNKRECESVSVNHTEHHGNDCPNFNMTAVNGTPWEWKPSVFNSISLYLHQCTVTYLMNIGSVPFIQ